MVRDLPFNAPDRVRGALAAGQAAPRQKTLGCRDLSKF
jgi:hypothetical protein